jgi:hypothetical protein
MGLLDAPVISRDKDGRRLDSISVPSKPGVRTATYPLTAPNGSTNPNFPSGRTQRSIFRVPSGVVRARLCAANRNLRSTAALTTAVTITGVWTGSPVRNSTTDRWKGDCTAALTQRVSTPLVIPVDRSVARTDWFSLSTYAADSDLVVSWGITGLNGTGNGVANGQAFQGVSASGSANAANATLSGATVGTSELYLDVWIEYEFVSTGKLVLAVGDSRTCQLGGAPPLIASADAGSLPPESWPMLAGAMTGAAVINMGVGSATATDFATTFPDLWTRVPVGGVIPDAVLIGLGTNQLSGTLAQFITDMKALNAYVRTTLQCNTIWWQTIAPRGYPDGAYTSGGTVIAGTLTAPSAAAATTLTTSFTAAAGVMVVGVGPNAEDVTVASVAGTTATLSAGLVNAHTAGEPVGQGNERIRKLINNYLRQIPDGITGVIDFEKLVEASPGSFTSDPRYIGSDYLHSPRTAGAPMAVYVADLAVRPLLG